MTATILTIHTLIVLGLIVVVLLQRSDGGALGIGGGGGGGGFMSGRGAANALTRTTSILAAIFFSTSLALAVMAGSGESDDNVLDELTGERQPIVAPGETPAEGPSTDDLLNSLGGDDSPEATVDAVSDTVTTGADGAVEEASSDVLNAIGSEEPETGAETIPDADTEIEGDTPSEASDENTPQ
ncbi:MAG: preprotein translocase subunit SecG [Hyphococcus sp.]|nr:MAG: preprotein translocase subunit SecG [Marinicaulis sp.]